MLVSDHHVHQKLYSDNWPPNHLREFSDKWGPDTEFPNHMRATSRDFDHVPNHLTNASDGWTHGVHTTKFDEPHQASISQHWPSNHIRVHSVNNIPAEPVTCHMMPISFYWEDQGHSEAYSSYWPTNHIVQMSRTFPAGHNRGMSSSFPPSHHHTVSKGWSGPTAWPTNHATSLSTDWDGPYPPGWPDFPTNHSWFTSARDIAGIAGSLRGLRGPTGGGQ